MNARRLLTVAVLLALPAPAAAAWTPARAVIGGGWLTAELAVGERDDAALAVTGPAAAVGEGCCPQAVTPLRVLRGPVRSRLPHRQTVSQRMQLLLGLRTLVDRRTVVAWTEVTPGPGAPSGFTPVPVAATAQRRGRFGGPQVIGPQTSGEIDVAVGETGLGLTVFRAPDGVVSVTRWRAGRPGRRTQRLEVTSAYAAPRVAIGAARDAVVAWCSDGIVRYVSGDARRRFGAPATIAGARCGAFLNVAAGPDGAAVATWLMGGEGSAMSVRVPGRPFGPPTQLATETAGIPIPLAAPGARTAALWSRQLGPSDTVTVNTRERAGTPVAVPCPTWNEAAIDPLGDVAVLGGADALNPEICTLRDGRRWHRERAPRSGADQYAVGLGGRAVAGPDGSTPSRVWYAGEG